MNMRWELNLLLMLVKTREEEITSIKIYSSKATDYENRVILLSKEIENYSRILKEKQNEIDVLKLKINDSQYIESKVAVEKKENERLTEVIRSQMEENESLKMRVSRMETEVRSYKVISEEGKHTK